MIIKTLADTYTKGGNAPVFGDPKDYRLDYENVEFKAEDGVTIRGWLIRGGTDKVVIQSHFGCLSSRSGYTPEGKRLAKPWDGEISFLRQAKYMAEDGYTVLMYDFRNHGNSDAGTLPWITLGPEEQKDVLAAVRFINSRPELSGCSIGLMSICMGSAATMFAYGRKDGLALVSNIKCLISVQPVNFDVSMRNNGLPGFINKRLINEFEKRVGYDLTAETFLPSVKRVTVPTMVIQNRNDPWTEIDHVKDIFSKLTVEKDYVDLDLENKRFAAYDYVGENSGQVLSFLNKYMK